MGHYFSIILKSEMILQCFHTSNYRSYLCSVQQQTVIVTLCLQTKRPAWGLESSTGYFVMLHCKPLTAIWRHQYWCIFEWRCKYNFINDLHRLLRTKVWLQLDFSLVKSIFCVIILLLKVFSHWHDCRIPLYDITVGKYHHIICYAHQSTTQDDIIE